MIENKIEKIKFAKDVRNNLHEMLSEYDNFDSFKSDTERHIKDNFVNGGYLWYDNYCYELIFNRIIENYECDLNTKIKVVNLFLKDICNSFLKGN